MTCKGDESEPSWIEIPDDLLIKTSGNHMDAIISAIYNDFQSNYLNFGYLQGRAILSTSNDFAEDINTHVMNLVPSVSKDYSSADSVDSSEESAREENLLWPTEYLNTVKIINFPNHV